MKVVFCHMLLDIRECISFYEGSQVSPVCPSDESSVNMKMFMLLWWNDTDRRHRNPYRETRPNPFLPATNPTCSVLGSDPGLRGEKLPTNHPFHTADLIENTQICDDMYAIVLPLYTVATAVKATCQNWRYFLRLT